VALTTHPNLAPRLKKQYSYTSTPTLGFHGLFWGEIYAVFIKVHAHMEGGDVMHQLKQLSFP